MIFDYYRKPHFWVESMFVRLREYLWEVFKEEGLFRVLLLGFIWMFLPDTWAILISALAFGLLHFLSFRWPMIVAASFLGIILGLVFIYTPYCWLAYLLCVLIHFGVGMVGIISGLTEKWLKGNKSTKREPNV